MYLGNFKIPDVSNDGCVPQAVSTSRVQFASLWMLLSLLWSCYVWSTFNNACSTRDKGSLYMSD